MQISAPGHGTLKENLEQQQQQQLRVERSFRIRSRMTYRLEKEEAR